MFLFKVLNQLSNFNLVTKFKKMMNSPFMYNKQTIKRKVPLRQSILQSCLKASLLLLLVIITNHYTFANSRTNEGACLVASISETQPTCGNSDGSLEAVVLGDGNYTFEWSTGETTSSISNLSDGIYRLTITDTDGNGCSLVSNLILATNENPPFLLNSHEVTNATCNGANDGEICFDALEFFQGGDPNPTITDLSGNIIENTSTNECFSNLVAGSYALVGIDDDGCYRGGIFFEITEPQTIEFSASIEKMSCSEVGGTISTQVSNGIEPYVYNWSDGSSNATATNLLPDNYSVVVTDANNCTASIDNLVIIEDCTSIIGDFVWEDTNSNGLQDADENGLFGIAITLTGTDINGNLVTMATTSAADGSYAFTVTEAGDYRITFAVPTGYGPTFSSSGNADQDSDLDQLTASVDLRLGGGERFASVDAGFMLVDCDACDNQFSGVLGQPSDETAPTIVGPSDIILECDATIPDAPDVTVTDNCDTNPAIDLIESTEPGACEDAYTFIRTWTATDACGNEAMFTQNITINDLSNPTFDNTPEDTTIECDAVPEAASVTASDNCDDDVEVTFSEQVTNGVCTDNFTLTRTWIATDNCGNASTHTQVITVQDTTDPVIVGTPASTSAECDAVPAAPDAGDVTATDNCDNDVEITFLETIATGACDESYTIARSWTAIDNCGNSAIVVQNISIGDNTPPVLAGVPLNDTAECDALPGPPVDGLVVAIDNCDNDVEITFSETTIAGSCTDSYTLRREWTATDNCGNQATGTQDIIISDTTAPVLSGVPADTTVECNAIPDADPNVSATDNCDNDTMIEISDNTITGSCAGNYIIERTWTATDNCGNTSNDTQIITVIDTENPALICTTTLAITIDGDETLTITPEDLLVSVDDCSPVSFELDQDQFTCSDIGSNLITLTATDDCGNTSNCISEVIVEVASEALACNNQVNVSLDTDCSAVITPDMILEGTPNCMFMFEVVISDENGVIPTSPMVTSDYVGQILTAEINDLVGGNSCWGTINVEYKLAPELTCQDTLSIPCTNDSVVPVYPDDYPDATQESCCEITQDNYSYEDEEIAGVSSDDACEGAFRRVWTITGCSGGIDTCSQVIIRTRPSVTDIEFPDDIILACGSDYEPEDLDGIISEGNYDEDYPNVEGDDIDLVNCNLGVSKTDQVIDLCAGSKKILRTWTAVDWCTGEILIDQQIIKILDEVAPTLTCPEDMTVHTSPNTCTASVSLPQPISLTDDCSTTSYIVETTTGTLTNLGTDAWQLADLTEGGPHSVTYIATDGCGNNDTCSFNITVVDNMPPIAVCDEFTSVSLGVNGTARVFATSFDDGSHDNCNDVFFKVRRMNIAECNLLNGDDNTITDGYQEYYDDFADFCCEDISDTYVQVMLRVYDIDPGDGSIESVRHEEGGDLYGRYNDCMVQVEVEDKLSPFIICPADLTISCEYQFDLNNLSEFGTIVTGDDTRNDIIIDDPANTSVAQPFNWGLDGYAADNCSVTITESVEDELLCGSGFIKRTFTATDADGRTSTCTQEITISNIEPFSEDDITWPTALIESDCSQGTDPSTYGEPTYTSDDCDNIFAGYEDLILSVAPPHCFKILRTWVIIDWCQYQPNVSSSAGRWEFTQVIKVSDTTAPTIVAPADITITSEEANCTSGPVTLALATGTDNCDDAVTISNDFNENGADASDTYPFGETVVTFTATDGCGNTTSTSMTVTVLDGLQPTPVCQFIASSVMPTNGVLELWASYFDAGSSYDNCTAHENLIFRIRKADSENAPPNNTVPNSNETVVYTCDDLGIQWVDLWVGDETGNWDHCRTYVDVQDPTGVCGGDTERAMIAGRIKTEEEVEIEDVLVDVAGNTMLDEMMTSYNGLFSFEELPMYNNYTVTPEKDSYPLNGVSTYDIILIQKHILGIEALNSPYKIIAADINKSNTVTGNDIIELRKLILHIDEEFQSNTSWRFVDKAFVFPTPTNPFQTTFPEVISFNSLSADELESDFVGLKVGDVNNSAVPSNLLGIDNRTTNGFLSFSVEDKEIKAGETVTIDFTTAEAKDILGYQFTLEFEGLEFINIAKGVSTNFGLANSNNGIISSSWNKFSNKGDSPDFSLTFKATTNTRLSEALNITSRYTLAEAYLQDQTSSEHIQDVALNFVRKEGNLTVGGNFELFQNQPNPFNDETSIRFNLPKASTASLTIYDVSGKILKQYNGNFARGYNEITIKSNELNTNGLLYYRLETAENAAHKKMLLVK